MTKHLNCMAVFYFLQETYSWSRHFDWYPLADQHVITVHSSHSHHEAALSSSSFCEKDWAEVLFHSQCAVVYIQTASFLHIPSSFHIHMFSHTFTSQHYSKLPICDVVSWRLSSCVRLQYICTGTQVCSTHNVPTKAALLLLAGEHNFNCRA